MNSNNLPDRFRGNPDFCAIELPRKAITEILEALSKSVESSNPFSKTRELQGILGSALAETDEALAKVRERLEPTITEKVNPNIGVRITSRPVVSVCASVHGSFGLDGDARAAEEVLRENSRFISPLWGDYSGRAIQVSHCIYCG